MNKKTDIFHNFENSDDDIVSELSYYCEPLSSVEEKRIFSLFEKKYKLRKNDFYDTDSVSGVDAYKRPALQKIISTAAILAVIFGIIGSVSMLSGFYKNKIKSDDISTESSITNANSQNNSTTKPSTDVYSVIEDVTHSIGENDVTYNLGESYETEEWVYCIQFVNVTKSGEGIDLYSNEYFSDNEDGDFICDYSYITADIEVTNNADHDRFLLLNSTRLDLYNYDETNKLSVYDSTETYAYTYNGERLIEAGDFFICDVKSGETKKFCVGYKISDSYLDQTFNLIRIEINHSGMACFTDKKRYYLIGEDITLNDISNH